MVDNGVYVYTLLGGCSFSPSFQGDHLLSALTYSPWLRMCCAQSRRQVFALHVGSAQSAGPDELRVIWATACDSLDTNVTRQMHGNAAGRPGYELWVGETFDRRLLEARMRQRFMTRGYLFTLRQMAL